MKAPLRERSHRAESRPNEEIAEHEGGGRRERALVALAIPLDLGKHQYHRRGRRHHHRYHHHRALPPKEVQHDTVRAIAVLDGYPFSPRSAVWRVADFTEGDRSDSAVPDRHPGADPRGSQTTSLRRTRYPDEIPGSDWDYGTNLAYLKELVAYWTEAFDWRAQERQMNGLDHFKTVIDDLSTSSTRGHRSKTPPRFSSRTAGPAPSWSS